MGYPGARTLVPVSIWSFVGKSDPFSTIIFSKFSRRISFIIFLPVALWTHQVSCLWNLPSWGIQELELGYPTANEEHEPFVVYETFLKNVPFKRFLLVALYTPSVLTKFHLLGNSLGGVPGSSNFGTRLNMVVCRQKWPFFTILFSKFSRRISLKNFLASCSICVLYTYQVSCLCKLPSWGTQ